MVQITDNWGYCNGNCDTASGLCFNNKCGNSDDMDNSATYFNGYLVVLPKNTEN